MKTDTFKKRTWVYVGKPATYGIPPCSCGNTDVVYSEYEEHLWCEKCQKDFIPEHWGVFDGPILLQVCELMGMSFSRLNLETDNIEKFNPETYEYETN